MFEPGHQLGQYRIVRFLGEGGMGSVYEAVHVELKRRVALKTLRAEVENLPNVVERFLREGQAAARIRHPHVVDVLDAGKADGTAFLVMEFLEGEDLEALLRRETRLSASRTADLMVPVMAAIDAVHRQGIVHRDLKPQNIFLTRDPYGEIAPKVLDFGISKLSSSNANLTTVGEPLGSPFYMSPEQARGAKTLDARSDQFSLGVLLYEMLTGVRPFDAPNTFAVMVAIQSATAMPVRERLPELPPGFANAVARAMSREPAERFESVLAFGRELLPFASDRTRLLWTPLFGAAEPSPADDDEQPAVPAGDRTVMRANPWDESNPTSLGLPLAKSAPPPARPAPQAPSPPSNTSPGAKRPSSTSPGAKPSPGAPAGARPPTGNSPGARPSSSTSPGAKRLSSTSPGVKPSSSTSPGSRPPPSAPLAARPSSSTSPGARPAPSPAPSTSARRGTGAAQLPRPAPAAPHSRAPGPAPVRRDTPPAPPRAAHAPHADPPARASRPVEHSEPGPAGCVCVEPTSPDAVDRVCDAVRGSSRLVLLFESKGPAPEERPPVPQVLECADGHVDVVVLEEVRRGLRDPMIDVCRELAPALPDAQRSYLFIEGAQVVHAVRKSPTNPLADAEKLTEWISRRIPGTRRFRRG